jgi:hypothetical protein
MSAPINNRPGQFDRMVSRVEVNVDQSRLETTEYCGPVFDWPFVIDKTG